jgi:hypothetical protein
MSQIRMYDICSICFCRVRWYHDWVGTMRYADRMWVERAHYKCWKRREEEKQNAQRAAKVDVSGVDNQFTLRTPEPRT